MTVACLVGCVEALVTSASVLSTPEYRLQHGPRSDDGNLILTLKIFGDPFDVGATAREQQDQPPRMPRNGVILVRSARELVNRGTRIGLTLWASLRITCRECPDLGGVAWAGLDAEANLHFFGFFVVRARSRSPNRGHQFAGDIDRENGEMAGRS